MFTNIFFAPGSVSCHCKHAKHDLRHCLANYASACIIGRLPSNPFLLPQFPLAPISVIHPCTLGWSDVIFTNSWHCHSPGRGGIPVRSPQRRGETSVRARGVQGRRAGRILAAHGCRSAHVARRRSADGAPKRAGGALGRERGAHLLDAVPARRAAPRSAGARLGMGWQGLGGCGSLPDARELVLRTSGRGA